MQNKTKRENKPKKQWKQTDKVNNGNNTEQATKTIKNRIKAARTTLNQEHNKANNN